MKSMKLFLSIKFYENAKNLEQIKSIVKTAKESGHEMVSICTDFEEDGKKKFDSRELMEITFREISKSDCVIIEFSEKGVGLGIEAGYAFSKNIPIFVIAKKGSDVSYTLQGISKKIFFYEETRELKEFFEKISL